MGHRRPLSLRSNETALPMSIDMSSVSVPVRTEPQKFLLIFLAALGSFGPASTDMYLPSFLAISKDLGTSYDNVQLTLSLFLLGFAVGQLVIGPLSDRFGRRPVLIAGVTLYCVTSLFCAWSTTIGWFILFRFLEAVGGCSGQVLGRAVMRDVYSGTALARAMSLMMLVMAIAPLLSPLIGAQILKFATWHTIFLILVVFGIFCLLGSIFYFKETHPPEKRKPLNVTATLAGYKAIFTNRHALGYLLTGGLAFGALFSYISGSPGAFMDFYKTSPEVYAIFFALNTAGFACGSMLNRRYVGQLGIDRILGMATPFCAAAAIVLSVLVFTLHLPFLLFALLLFFSICGVHLVFANAITGLLEQYPGIAGTASALFGSAQFGFGAMNGAFVGQFYDSTPRSMVVLVMLSMVGAFLAHRFLARGGAHGL
jgi:DHA1 family bicyclomycin/chloramphenicol resistance-like MFS transporter